MWLVNLIYIFVVSCYGKILEIDKKEKFRFKKRTINSFLF